MLPYENTVKDYHPTLPVKAFMDAEISFFVLVIQTIFLCRPYIIRKTPKSDVSQSCCDFKMLVITIMKDKDCAT